MNRAPHKAACAMTPLHQIPLASSDVEAVDVHHLRPHLHEVADEFVLRIRARLDLGEAAQDLVRTEHEVDARARPLELAALAVAAIEDIGALGD